MCNKNRYEIIVVKWQTLCASLTSDLDSYMYVKLDLLTLNIHVPLMYNFVSENKGNNALAILVFIVVTYNLTLLCHQFLYATEPKSPREGKQPSDKPPATEGATNQTGKKPAQGDQPSDKQKVKEGQCELN